jgi:phage recombination protein Bet
MTARFASADMCPVCTRVHGQPTDWPQCPQHGHLLVQLTVTDAGWHYYCPAHKCKHTHTQPERATMTQAIEAQTTALAVRDDQDSWTPQQLAALTQLGVENASKGDLDVFLHRCQVTGLDPFTGQIAMIRRGGKWTIQTGIDGYRVIGHRAAVREGIDLTYGPTLWFDAAGGPHEIWLGDDPPSGAMVTIYKGDKPFTGIARYKSFVQLKDGKPMAQWAVMPDHLLAKCAEAQAFRRAFPFDLQDITTPDETAHDMPAPPVTVQQERPLPPIQPPAQRTRTNGEALRTAIGKQFDRLALMDREERNIYVYKLANKERGVDLTDGDLRFILDALVDCADIGELQDLCSPAETT